MSAAKQAIGTSSPHIGPITLEEAPRNPGSEDRSYEWMTTADNNRPKSVKNATNAPLPAKTAASCAATEPTSTKKSSGRLPLVPAPTAVRLWAARSGTNLLKDARPGRDLLGARYAGAPLPDDRTVRCRCAWFRPIPVPSLRHPSRGA